ncbi:DNA-directed RNA polymerase II subunit RPB2-like [Paramacrobiotus metropolitanus]|uniref:DNA-directed RNA polymerase II subunit RPB2-like n=1 Tax=Paramacrobiotus metropolitanus TaxID=2943436 RepID=UPI002446349B|nr:DNA-directed RNA polymerase II subunit RPB2-like [Paramacrobiotus metropolitanus]
MHQSSTSATYFKRYLALVVRLSNFYQLPPLENISTKKQPFSEPEVICLSDSDDSSVFLLSESPSPKPDAVVPVLESLINGDSDKTVFGDENIPPLYVAPPPSPSWRDDCCDEDHEKLALGSVSDDLAEFIAHDHSSFYERENDETTREGIPKAGLSDYIDEDVYAALGSAGWEEAAWLIIQSFFDDKGLVQQQLDSFNKFVSTDLPEIVTSSLPIVIRKKDESFGLKEPNPEDLICYRYTFEGVGISSPFREGRTSDSGVSVLHPLEVRLRDLTYDCNLWVDIKETIQKHGCADESSIEKIYMGRLSIMVRSDYCQMHNQNDPVVVSAMGECVHDPGGYFIIDGSEKIDNIR